MNTRCFSSNTRIRVLYLLLLAILTVGVTTASAQHKKLLIINSYGDNEPWVNGVTQPLVTRMAQEPHISSEIISLNNALVLDSIEFYNTAANIMAQYADDPPAYVVMIGTLAFNLRQLIKEQWGDETPMMLVTTTKDYAPVSDYFNPKYMPFEHKVDTHLSSLRSEYNFTAVIIPVYYKETVALMIDLIPDMDHLVFMSDSIYVNRKIAYDLQVFLKEEYPDIRFTWLKANPANGEVFLQNLTDRQPNTGFLLSTWLYEKRNANGVRIPTSADLKILPVSVNPIFSMHESYISYGVAGGVFPDIKIAQNREVEVLEQMIAGKSMRDVPFFVCEQSYPCLNSGRLSTYGLKERNAPEGTVFYNRPDTFVEKYFWQMLAGILLAVLVIGLYIRKSIDQNRTTKMVNRNAEFINNMPIPYSTAKVRYDSDNNITTIAYTVKNEAFNRILDDNVEEGSPFLLFPAKFIAPKVKELLSTRKMQVFIYHFEQTDTYYEFILCLVNSDKDNKVKRAQKIDVFAIDITSRYKGEESLRQAKKKLDLSVQVTKLIPWEYNVKTNIISYDEFGKEEKSNYGIPVADGGSSDFDQFLQVVHPDDREKVARIRNGLSYGRTDPFTIVYRRYVDQSHSKWMWFEMNGVVNEVDEDGKALTVIGSTQNINDRVIQQQQMAEALEKANESDRMKSTFLANMSHEIRTPLNAIVGFSNVIANTESAEERHEFVEIINHNNEQLLSLINDVLDLAKIESNTIFINYAECDVNEMMDQVKKTMAMKVPSNVKFELVKSHDVCLAELDQMRVMQILNNMISNSCKFTQEGSITFGYEITDHGMLYFYVSDTGAGIAKEDQQKIFDRFVKLNAFVPGSGLGLAICKNLVEKMGGEIGVESSGDSQGSLFWFTVPYVPIEGVVKSQFDSQLFTKSRLDMDLKLKVLIAEDNDSNYQLLAHLLRSTFDLVRANNGEEALRMFVQEDPDVILMDISMPGVDGYQAFDEIRQFSKTVPIIAVTAYVYGSDRKKLLDYGFNGYVSKPLTQKSILDAIGHVLMK